MATKRDLIIFAHRGEAQVFLENSPYIEWIKQNESLSPIPKIGLFVPKDNKEVEKNNVEKNNNDKPYILITGEGLQNAGDQTLLALSLINKEISRIINLGVAGAVNAKFHLHQIVEVKTAHSQTCKNFLEAGIEFKTYSSEKYKGLELPYVDLMSIHARALTPSDKELFSQYVDILDREAFALFRAAQYFNFPFHAFKIISDSLDEKDFCNKVLEDSHQLANSLFLFYQNYLTGKSIVSNDLTFSLPASIKHLLPEPFFYFTHYQASELKSLIPNTASNSTTAFEQWLGDYQISEIVEQLKEVDLSPKERSKRFLLVLQKIKNPLVFKIKELIESEKNKRPLSFGKIQHDSKLESSTLHLHFEVKNSVEWEKSQLEIRHLDLEPIFKILQGDF